jgi:hypothetical protein
MWGRWDADEDEGEFGDGGGDDHDDDYDDEDDDAIFPKITFFVFCFCTPGV